MAASWGKHTKLTLTVSRLCLKDKNQSRHISVCRKCLGNTWHVHDKPRRLQEIKIAPAVNKATPKSDVKEISIPDKIERSPTAVLEALASTVRNDINQPIFMSIDDPHLYLTSDRSKISLLAAMESGRKTARMMLSMYPDYFTQIWEEPLPDSLKDITEGYRNKEPSEEALLERITRLHVGDAITVYKALMANKQPPSQETQEKLLELLTAFNCKNQETVSDLSNYISPVSLDKNVPMPASTWREGNMAEQVFNSLPEKTARAYCFMIQGMASNYEKEGALALYNEMKVANLPVDVFTYNWLLTVASLDTETWDDVAQYIEMILKDMAANKVIPDVETFNSVLSNCRRLSRWRGSKAYAFSVLSEMKACGIDPSLGTYKQLLSIFYYKATGKSERSPELFEKILQDLAGKEFQCKTENDVTFFRTAMRVVATQLPDAKLALEIHSMLKTGKNSDLLGHRQLKYAYYNDFFSVITPLEHIDSVMEIYQEVVPYIFLPTSEIYKAILESVRLHGGYKYVPQLYADMQWTSIFKDQFFIEFFAQTLAMQKQDPQLQAQFCNIVSSLLKSWMEKKDRQSRDIPHMDGSVIGHFITVHLNNDNLQKARELLQLYLSDRSVKRNDPSEESLNKLAEHLIGDQDYISLKEVLELMLDLDYSSLSTQVKKATQTLQLTDQERNYLQGLAAEASSSSSSDSD